MRKPMRCFPPGLAPKLCLLVLAAALSSYAQTVAGYGTVTGTVRDPYGDGLPDSTVLITNELTGLRRIMTTTDDGLFSAPEMTPGTGYNIKITRTGYQAWEYKDFDVSIGYSVNFSVVLNLATNVDHVDASASGFTSAVEETRSNVSTLISRRQLENLPDPKRTLDPLVSLAPLAVRDRATGTIVFRGEPSTNGVYTDGVNTTTTYYLQTPSLAPQLRLDSIYETQVLSTGAPADMGFAMGGYVNAATQNGIDAFHGALYGYTASADWRSAPRFAPAFAPDDKQRQFGGAIGGPIFAGKLYFFLNAERYYGNRQGLNTLANPLLAGPNGTSLSSNCRATAAQCAAAIAFLSPQLNQVVSSNPGSTSGLARIDYRRSDRHAVSLEGNALHANAPNGLDNEVVSPNGGLVGGNGNLREENRFAKADWAAAVSSVLTNDARLAVYRDRLTTSLDPSLYPRTGALGLNIGGASIGGNPNAPSTLTETRYSFADSFTFSTGAHSIRLGGEMDRNRDAASLLPGQFGNYTYPTLTAFAQDLLPVGQPRSYSLFEQTVGEPNTNIRSTQLSAFANDEWRATRHLRLTLGVRWEKVKFPAPPAPNTAYFQTGTIASPSTNFAPRVGITYLVNDRTLVRGGVGFFYQPFTGSLMRELYAETSFNQTTITGTPTQSGSFVFPNVSAGFNNVPNGMKDIAFGTNKFRNPYAQVGTLGIERRVNARTAVAVTYVDQRTKRMWTATDQNLTGPVQTAPTFGFETYTIQNAAGSNTGTYQTPVYTLQTIGTTTSGKSDPASAHVWQINNSGNSVYRAVTMQVREQALYGLSLQAEYTWSHATDDVSGPPVVGGVVPATTLPGNFRNDQGNSNFDQRNRIAGNLVWQPPFLKGNNSLPARFFINGWVFSATGTYGSSLPETPLLYMTGGQQFANANLIYLTSLNGSGGWNRVPFLPVNSLKIGSEANVDARITRTLPFTERVQAKIFLEAFNALNHQYTTSLYNVAYTAQGGILRPVTGYGSPASAAPPRFLQVGLRLTF
ncbi:MAG TPA: carboxypeptidase regulatory-like domain-containing protein [Candidatus Limnocylindrales bacterium]|nr:carboxypeptidase regulatory-like domain-containing protein [Candidatus Limnocylindrales bacterium]